MIERFGEWLRQAARRWEHRREVVTIDGSTPHYIYQDQSESLCAWCTCGWKAYRERYADLVIAAEEHKGMRPMPDGVTL